MKTKSKPTAPKVSFNLIVPEADQVKCEQILKISEIKMQHVNLARD